MKDLKQQTNNYTPQESVINYYDKYIHEKVSRYFNRKSIVDWVTKYELYYHVSLGNYAFETLLDIKETAKKLGELKLEVSAVQVLFKLYDVIQAHSDEEQFEQSIDLYIRKEAALHALNDFLEKDSELIGKKYYAEQKKEDIQNDMFFNEMMWHNFEVNYQKTFEHFSTILTPQFLENIQNKIMHSK